MILLLVILLAAYLIWRVRTPPHQQRVVERKAEEIILRNTAQASNSLRRFRQRIPFLMGDNNKKLVEQMRTWINTNWLNADGGDKTEVRALAQWLNTLNEKDFTSFVHRMNDSASLLGVSLSDMLDSTAMPELKETVDEVMRLCALSVWKSEDMKALIAYQQWSQAPDKYRDQKLVEQLYTSIVKAGFVQPNVEALMQTDQQRQVHIIDSIRRAAEEHHSEFISVLKQTVSGSTVERTNSVIKNGSYEN